EKREFVPLFGKLVERTYMDKVEDYSGEKVRYEGERVKGKYGLVKAKVVTNDKREIDVDYRLKYKRSDWYVYDVTVVGVSLVKSYRVQFNDIIMQSSYEELVKRLKDKLAAEE
ncbi:MAG: ABC transporter substrate-binding protein, partial [Desulfobacterales bacterium]|nr:ABC transporter substrate-binding protein [Desulfobacterales bacterium]